MTTLSHDTLSTPRAAGIPYILKKAFTSSLIALVLFSLMVGMRTEAGPDGQLTFWSRFGELGYLVGIVFGGSIVTELLRQWLRRSGAERLVPPAARRGMSFVGRFLAPALLIFALLVPIIFYNQRYILDLGILVLTYVMLGWGLNVVIGLAGLLDLGYVAFYAVGAYSYGLLATSFGWSFWICLPLAGILAAFWGMLLGFPVLRLRGDYLAIVTLAFGEIIRLVIINWQSLTGGPNGVSGIPRPTMFGIPLDNSDDGFAALLHIEYSPTHRIVFLFYLILALALLTNWVTIRLRRLPIGRAWEALREDEVACRALGINTTKDGRMTNANLADAVGLSASPCLQRVKRLEGAGYINGYGAHINLAKLTESVTVFTEVTLIDHRKEDFVRFEANLRNIDELMECHLVSGGYDYLLRFLSRSIKDYQESIENLLERNIGIEKYFSYIVLKSPIVKNVLPLKALLDSAG